MSHCPISQTLKVFVIEYQDEGIMTLSENDLLVRIADHVAKLSDIVTKQSKTILDLDSRINDLENRLKPFEKAVENQRARKKQKK
jgi:archaellum component FlaC